MIVPKKYDNSDLIITNTDKFLSEMIMNSLDKLEGEDNNNPYFFDLSVINNIPSIHLDGLSKQEEQAISILSREVLLKSKKENHYKEISITYRTDKPINDNNAVIITKGDTGQVDFFENDKVRELILNSPDNMIFNFHNHPDYTNFSLKDIMIFTTLSQIKLMEIINPQGQVSVLYKPQKYYDLNIITTSIISTEIPDLRQRINIYNIQNKEELTDFTKILTSNEKNIIAKKIIPLLEEKGIIYLGYKGKEDLQKGEEYYGKV